MFKIDVNFKKTIPNSQITEIQNAYLSGMSLSEAENHFDDYFSCVEAAIALAIDKGWNLDAAINANMQYMYDYFYNALEGGDDICRDIVTEAMEYIQSPTS